MNKVILVASWLLACFIFGSGFTGIESYWRSSTKTAPENLQIYLLIGQSNMAGRAPLESQDKDTLERVLLFTGIPPEYWEKAANPLNKYSTIRKELNVQALGPGYTFAKVMALADPESEIGLVVNARGGTSINEWLPGTKYYQEAVSRSRIAMKSGTLKGILWHQGESDIKEYNLYPGKLESLVSALRKDLGVKDLPFVAGELSEDKPGRMAFNRMLVALPGKISHFSVVSIKGLTTFDSTHFDSKSQRILGERFATEMINLQKRFKN